MINLDYQKRLPIYEQIVSEIERYVALGILKPKDQIPSIRELAHQLGINPNTVKKAYDLLESRHVIVTISTKGTYISDETNQVVKQKTDNLLNQIEEQIKELKQLGLTNEKLTKLLDEMIRR